MFVVINWLETCMDVSCGGFMGLLKCMSFGHLVPEWLFMMLNFTSVLTNVVMVV